MNKVSHHGARWAWALTCALALSCGDGTQGSPPDQDGTDEESEQDERREDEGPEDEGPSDESPSDERPSDGDGDSHSGSDASLPSDAGVAQDAGAPDGSTGPVPVADASTPTENFFSDAFDDFDLDDWKCEYSCPTVADGAARYRLEAGIAPNHQGSWSKSSYTGQRFTAGRFTVSFALTARPEQKVWWGVALWDNGPNPDGSEFNEVNFGYTTDQSFTNTELRFESARRGNAVSLKVDTGVDLYDGSYHTATLEYDASHVAFYFDGELLETITDPDVIPTDPMKFVLGPRLVTGSEPLETDFVESVDWTEIEW